MRRSAGSGSYDSAGVFSIDNQGKLTRRNQPQRVELHGHMGHDRFFTKARFLYREFPVCRAGDSNSHPTGGTAVDTLDLEQ